MDVKNILISAKEAVEQADLPDDLRVAGFTKAIELLSGTSVVNMPAKSSAGGSQNGQASEGPLERLAAKLKVGLETLQDVFHDENGEVKIGVSPTKLAKSKTAATQQLALLVAAARQGTGADEDFTLVDEIRKVAEEFRKYDAGNFARSINEMSDDFSFRGNRSTRAVKVSRPGWLKASDLVRKLGGEEV